jgi:hypothetical protein
MTEKTAGRGHVIFAVEVCGDWAKEDKLLEASVFGFRGWQVNPNLIFGDGEMRLRPQMEVWLLPRSLTLWGKNALRI